MPNVSRGKEFETVIRKALLSVPGVSVIRLHDQTSGFYGSKNECDLIAYRYPYQYCLELKSVHGNTLPFANITEFQWQSRLQMSKVPGVRAGIICWWVDRDTTKYVPIETLEIMRENNSKSVSYHFNDLPMLEIHGKKKRVFYDYDLERFFTEVDNVYSRVSESREC